MGDLERKEIVLTDVKASSDGAGSFEGYGSLFNIRDKQGDIVLPGAYADTLAAFVEQGFISWSHDWTDNVATIRSAHEDEKGLFLVADFHSDVQSQQARTRTMERLSRGKQVGLSIGYRAVDADFTDSARVLKKIDLFEVSLVAVPALAAAGVTAAKGGSAVVAEEKGALRPHGTDTTDAAWDGPAHERRLPNEAGAALYKRFFAYQDPDGDPDAKGSYKFGHHMVSADGTVGAANLKAASSGIGVLNGGRGGTVLEGADRDGVFAHLAKHIADSGADAPPLKALPPAEAKEGRRNATKDAERIQSLHDLATQLGAACSPADGDKAHDHAATKTEDPPEGKVKESRAGPLAARLAAELLELGVA